MNDGSAFDVTYICLVISSVRFCGAKCSWCLLTLQNSFLGNCLTCTVTVLYPSVTKRDTSVSCITLFESYSSGVRLTDFVKLVPEQFVPRRTDCRLASDYRVRTFKNDVK